MSRYSLDNVTIDGFRGLRNLRLNDLGLINVLVGPNNCGKTSVLEALSILGNASDPSEWLWVVRRRDFGELDETRIQSLRWCFSQSAQIADPETIFEGECRMTCSGLFPLTKLTAGYKEIEGAPVLGHLERTERHSSFLEEHGTSAIIDGRDLDLQPGRGAEITHCFESDGSLLRSGASVPQPVAIQVWEDYPDRPARPRRRSRAPTETLTPYSYQINRMQVRHYSQYVLGREQDIVSGLLRTFDPDIIGIELASLRGGRPAIYLKHQRFGPAPLSVFGDALRRALLLAGTVFSLKDGGVLLIDEIETGIHVSTLQRVMNWLTGIARELRVQVVATTHSLEAVDAMALGIPDGLSDLVTYHLDQTEQETRVKRIDGELLLRLRRERALDVR